jgi:hypothetical protein
LGILKPVFDSNIVWGLGSFYDEECISNSLKINMELYNKKFSKKFIDKVKKYTLGDPTATKRITMQAVNIATYEKEFLATEGLSDLYSLVGEEWFLDRYKDLLLNISKESVQNLIDKNYSSSSDFLKNTGLVIEEGLGFKLMNPFLDHFLDNYAEDIIKEESWATQKIVSPSEYLSGQELIAFTLFKKREEEIISKDALAEVIWGEEWEEKYSDWAIDKLVSNIRKKLKENNYPKSLNSIKGRGIVLS